jgi:hypothetical protein
MPRLQPMQALYDYGYQQARAGKEWHKAPPALAREAGKY